MLTVAAPAGHFSRHVSLGGVLFVLLFLCFGAAGAPSRRKLPSDVPINNEAGRGGWLIVKLQLGDGEDVPFIVDSGTSGTFIDKSLEPKLGKLLGTAISQGWGVISTNNVYAAPKLYLGGVQLVTDSDVITSDFSNDSRDAGQPILGILGIDVLQHYCIQLDFAAKKMRFLDDTRANKRKWGKAFPIVALNSRDSRPSVAYNLLGLQGPHSLIDSGCDYDGWLMPKYFDSWTNRATALPKGETYSPNGYLDGEKYLFLSLARNDVESDGIGLRFLARHLVTMDFPNHTLYLKRESIVPLPDPGVQTTPMPALQPLVNDVLQEDVRAARRDLVKIEHGRATAFEKNVARHLEATLENSPKPSPADVPPSVTQMPLGDCHPELAEVGWLQPVANRIPLNAEIVPPFLDSGKIYATGLFAHSPSRYVFNLGGKWNRLRGEAGLHTAFQGKAYGVVFVIKTDGREVFRSPAIHGSEHVSYDGNLKGVKTLELIVEKAQEQNGGDWGLWLDPTLSRDPH